MSRAFVVVLDACGVGALPDAADYGDAGANTLGHLAGAAGGLRLPDAAAALASARSSTYSGCPAGRSPVCTAASTRSARARTRRPGTGS